MEVIIHTTRTHPHALCPISAPLPPALRIFPDALINVASYLNVFDQAHITETCRKYVKILISKHFFETQCLQREGNLFKIFQTQVMPHAVPDRTLQQWTWSQILGLQASYPQLWDSLTGKFGSLREVIFRAKRSLLMQAVDKTYWTWTLSSFPQFRAETCGTTISLMNGGYAYADVYGNVSGSGLDTCLPINAQCLAESPGRGIITGSRRGHVDLWGYQGNHIRRFSDSSEWIYSVAVCPNGDVVAATFDPGVRRWSPDGDSCTILEGNTKGVRFVLPLTNNSVIGHTDESFVHLWSSDGSYMTRLECNVHSDGAIAPLPGGGVVTGSGTGFIKFWDAKGTLTLLRGLHENSVTKVAALSTWGIFTASVGRCHILSITGDLLAVLNPDVTTVMLHGVCTPIPNLGISPLYLIMRYIFKEPRHAKRLKALMNSPETQSRPPLGGKRLRRSAQVTARVHSNVKRGSSNV